MSFLFCSRQSHGFVSHILWRQLWQSGMMSSVVAGHKSTYKASVCCPKRTYKASLCCPKRTYKASLCCPKRTYKASLCCPKRTVEASLCQEWSTAYSRRLLGV